VIDPRLDILVWAAVLLVLLLMGARAWAVETAGSRHYRTSARVRVLTGATGLAVVALVGIVAMQGGIAFVQAIVTSTDPETFVTIVGDDETATDAVDDPDDGPQPPGAPADPNAPPADPNAPPAGPNPAPAEPPGAPNGGAGAGADAPPAAPGG
jgi:hypothetical protein